MPRCWQPRGAGVGALALACALLRPAAGQSVAQVSLASASATSVSVSLDASAGTTVCVSPSTASATPTCLPTGLAAPSVASCDALAALVAALQPVCASPPTGRMPNLPSARARNDRSRPRR